MFTTCFIPLQLCGSYLTLPINSLNLKNAFSRAQPGLFTLCLNSSMSIAFVTILQQLKSVRSKQIACHVCKVHCSTETARNHVTLKNSFRYYEIFTSLFQFQKKPYIIMWVFSHILCLNLNKFYWADTKTLYLHRYVINRGK